MQARKHAKRVCSSLVRGHHEAPAQRRVSARACVRASLKRRRSRHAICDTFARAHTPKAPARFSREFARPAEVLSGHAAGKGNRARADRRPPAAQNEIS
jgi:hypothetical protein